ncbi:MAG: hypothetical protein AAGD07_23745 [Planctomycetota bacterium]
MDQSWLDLHLVGDLGDWKLFNEVLANGCCVLPAAEKERRFR